MTTVAASSLCKTSSKCHIIMRLDLISDVRKIVMSPLDVTASSHVEGMGILLPDRASLDQCSLEV